MTTNELVNHQIAAWQLRDQLELWELGSAPRAATLELAQTHEKILENLGWRERRAVVALAHRRRHQALTGATA